MTRAMDRIRPWLAWLTVAWLVGAATAVVRPVVGWLAWRRGTVRRTDGHSWRWLSCKPGGWRPPSARPTVRWWPGSGGS